MTGAAPKNGGNGERALRHFGFAFLAAVALYAVVFTWIEHRRVRNGPWTVEFGASPGGMPAITIRQPRLSLTNIQIVFSEAGSPSNPPVSLDFREARKVPFEVPYGRCVFLDTTFLPGTVTLQLFGHEIELLPRTLILDHQERAWNSGQTLTVR